MAESNPKPGLFEHLVKRHPCFNDEAHFQYGRIHLPVSPACNIQCRFCQRGFNKWEQRPGVSRKLLRPDEAVQMVGRALQVCPEITVVGIAGPGDTLATDHALTVFEQVHRYFPQLVKCLSTNGLLLAEKAERLNKAGVQTVTVTVNSLDERVLPKICSQVVVNQQVLQDEDAARALIAAQKDGIKRMADLGAVIKINTVLIPGINDHCLAEIAAVTAGLGASRMNIIPLIPQHEFQNWPAPDCQQLNSARILAEKHLAVFRHCKHCRADACGIPGTGREISEELYEHSIPMTFSHG